MSESNSHYEISTPPLPRKKEERKAEIDILRGFALIGVLLVNLTMIDVFQQPMEGLWPGFIDLLWRGKFYTLFAFLFGWGFQLFLSKSERGMDEDLVKKLYKRRLKFLIIFGILHYFFIWEGDILLIYGVIGLILLRKSKHSSEALLGKAKKLFVMAFILSMVSGLLNHLIMNASFLDFDKVYGEILEIHGQNSYWSLFLHRLKEGIFGVPFNILFMIPNILGLFYLGYLAGKEKILEKIIQGQAIATTLLKKSAGLFAIGLMGIVSLDLLTDNTTIFTSPIREGFHFLTTLGGGAFYGTMLLVALQREKVRKSLSFLGDIGKMALTNYLIQTIFWTTALYGYGLGLGGKIPYGAYIPIAFIFILLQGIFSNLWLKKFRYGPMEGLWRKLTYGKLT